MINLHKYQVLGQNRSYTEIKLYDKKEKPIHYSIMSMKK